MHWEHYIRSLQHPGNLEKTGTLENPGTGQFWGEILWNRSFLSCILWLNPWQTWKEECTLGASKKTPYKCCCFLFQTLSHSHIIYHIKMSVVSLLGFHGTAVKETGATFLQISWFISITPMSSYKNVFMYFFLPL